MSVEPIAVQPVAIFRSHESIPGHSLLYTPSISQQQYQGNSNRSLVAPSNFIGQPFLTNNYSSNQFYGSNSRMPQSYISGSTVNASLYQSLPNNQSSLGPSILRQSQGAPQTQPYTKTVINVQPTVSTYKPLSGSGFGSVVRQSQPQQHQQIGGAPIPPPSPNSLSGVGPMASTTSTNEAQAAFAYYVAKQPENFDFTAGSASNARPERKHSSAENLAQMQAPGVASMGLFTDMKEVDVAEEQSQLSTNPRQGNDEDKHSSREDIRQDDAIKITIHPLQPAPQQKSEDPIPRSATKPSQRILQSIVARSRSGSRKQHRRRDGSKHRSKGDIQGEAQPEISSVHQSDHTELRVISEEAGQSAQYSSSQSAKSEQTIQSNDSEAQEVHLDLRKMTDIQRYELCMLEERKNELYHHVQEMAAAVMTRNDEIIEREILLTQVDSSDKSS